MLLERLLPGEWCRIIRRKELSIVLEEDNVVNFEHSVRGIGI